MSATAIIANVIMSVLVLVGICAGLLATARARPGQDEGRAYGRGPLHVLAAARAG